MQPLPESIFIFNLTSRLCCCDVIDVSNDLKLDISKAFRNFDVKIYKYLIIDKCGIHTFINDCVSKLKSYILNLGQLFGNGYEIFMKICLKNQHDDLIAMLIYKIKLIVNVILTYH